MNGLYQLLIFIIFFFLFRIFIYTFVVFFPGLNSLVRQAFNDVEQWILFQFPFCSR